ncbi:hypothetical protein [Microbacterium maritypicum]|uniref:hypothetical protein n=1 Tax=Microbacterium maritypicum TaxID=33918 RepID=UPI00382E8BFF
MIFDGPPDEVLAGQCKWESVLTSWLGGRMLAATVPISSGRVTGKVDDDIIETLAFTVPRHAAPVAGEDTFDWRPGRATDHPLARYGQKVDVTIRVTSVITGQVWDTRIGRYQIKNWDDDDDGLISVKGESLLAKPRDDGLLVPTSPTGTFKSEARRLAPAGMGVSFDAGLVDRAVPSAMSWSEDRLKAFKEIADAWPALLRIDPWGQIRFASPLQTIPIPVHTLKDGEGGTLITMPTQDSRDDVPNLVAVSTGSSSSADVQAIAAITSGPMSINGDYGIVTKKWSSSAIENNAQALAAAQADLVNSSRPAQTVPVRIAPDPRIEYDDPIEVKRGDDTPLWGWVVARDIPLTAGDGDMRIDIGLPA